VPKPRPRRKVDRQQGPHLIQRDGVYYASLGQRRRVSLRTRDRAEAELAFAKLLSGEAPDVRRAARAAEITLTEITEQYLMAPHGWTRQTLRSASQRATAFAEWCASRGLTLPAQLTSPSRVRHHAAGPRGPLERTSTAAPQSA
jgi:hypothetical protein